VIAGSFERECWFRNLAASQLIRFDGGFARIGDGPVWHARAAGRGGFYWAARAEVGYLIRLVGLLSLESPGIGCSVTLEP
jgi:hypothetical protein